MEYVLLHEPFVLLYGKGTVSTVTYAQMTNNLSGYDLFHYFAGCCLKETAELEACVEWVMYERGLWQ